MRPIIDVCGVVYDQDSWDVHLHTFAERAPGYLRFFGYLWVDKAGADPSAYARALDRDPHEAAELLMAGGGLARDPAHFAAGLDEQGIRHVVIHGGQASLPDGGTVNDRTVRFARAAPGRVSAWAGLDLADPNAAVEELTRCVTDLGMTGASVVPFNAGVDPDSAGCHRIYARAAELGVPIWIHTGMSLAANRPLDSCTWLDIDRIAVAHPDLTVIAGHGGWPWITEAVAVLQRHPNVFMDISAHRPRVMGRAGSGWEPLLFYGRHAVRDKVLFGSSDFVQPVTTRELADEVEDLDLGERAVSAWLHDNGARLLGLESLATVEAGRP